MLLNTLSKEVLIRPTPWGDYMKLLAQGVGVPVGNTVSGHYKRHYPLPFYSVLRHLNLFTKVDGSTKTPRGRHLSRPVVLLGTPWRPLWILQAVSECLRYL